MLAASQKVGDLASVGVSLSSGGEETRFALAWIDISTGEFRLTECDRAALSTDRKSVV